MRASFGQLREVAAAFRTPSSAAAGPSFRHAPRAGTSRTRPPRAAARFRPPAPRTAAELYSRTKPSITPQQAPPPPIENHARPRYAQDSHSRLPTERRERVGSPAEPHRRAGRREQRSRYSQHPSFLQPEKSARTPFIHPAQDARPRRERRSVRGKQAWDEVVEPDDAAGGVDFDPWENAEDSDLQQIAHVSASVPDMEARPDAEASPQQDVEESEESTELQEAEEGEEREGEKTGPRPPGQNLRRLPLHPIFSRTVHGKQSLLRVPVTLHTLGQAPHFPYSLSVMGAILAPVVSHNDRRADEQFWKDSAAERASKEARRAQEEEERRAANRAGRAYEKPFEPVDSLQIPLEKPWLHPERRRISPRKWSTLEATAAFPHAAFGERYFLWRGEVPQPGEGQMVDDPDSHWAVLCADVDGAPEPQGLVDLRFYASDEPWLARESGGWEYDPAGGRLRDRGAAVVTNTPAEPDDPVHVVREGEEEDGAGCDPGLGFIWFHGQQTLTRVLDEFSKLGRPVRMNSISQLWVPTVRKIAGYLRVRPRTVEVTYYTRWVLPRDAALLAVEDEGEVGRVERDWGMQFSRVKRRETEDLAGPLRQTPRYLQRGLQFSTALRPHAASPNAGNVLYGAQTVNTDLSLSPPLILPQHARSGLHSVLMGQTARRVHRGLTQTVDNSTAAVRALSALPADSLPLHAKIPVSDRATAAFLRASGWKEVYGGVADVRMEDWYEVAPEQFETERAERRTGMTEDERMEVHAARAARARTSREEARRMSAEEQELGGPLNVEDKRRRMNEAVQGVFSNPAKPGKWDI